MIQKIIRNDIRKNKVVAASTCFFMAVSVLLFILTIYLFGSVFCSIGSLMEQAKSPDFIQMHAGHIEEKEICDFADKQPIAKWQVCHFLNLENGMIELGGHSLADSTQDNGVCVPNSSFDCFVSMEEQSKIDQVEPGKIYVPVVYQRMYDISQYDKVRLYGKEFVIAGFLRDSQMNSMMASSKRFLVSDADYQALMPYGEKEYLIEFLLQDRKDIKEVAQAYVEAQLPSNGPTITYALIRMMNVLSEGIMVLVLLLIATVISIFSIICNRFIILTGLEKDRREIGMLKAIGVSKSPIRGIYFAKYDFLAAVGFVVGVILACFLRQPFVAPIHELYGMPKQDRLLFVAAVCGSVLLLVLQLFLMWRVLKKTEEISPVKCLQGVPEQKRRGTFRQYLFIGGACVITLILLLIPQNIKSTMTSKKFVNYMGIGEAAIRIDIRQTEQIEEKTEKLTALLQRDMAVEQFVSLKTVQGKFVLPDGTRKSLMVETGNHSVFPVRYVAGHEPRNERELALSVLNAKELSLSLGDQVSLVSEQGEEIYQICGIYSDITNGGKTAKAVEIPSNRAVVWSVSYLNLRDSQSRQEWIDGMKSILEEEIGSIKLVSIEEYVNATYGQTVAQIKKVSLFAAGLAATLLFVVVSLFVRMLLETERYDISVQKALGFTNKRIQWSYLKRAFGYAVAGNCLGILFGNIFGNQVAGMLLSSMGASGFVFVVNYPVVYFLMPCFVILSVMLATWIAVQEIKKIHPYECCMGEGGCV